MAYMNVREPWEIHDSICVRNTLYGSEAAAGFFTTFVGLGQQSELLFFKRRSEGNVHLAYCNQQAEDRSDFVFHIFSVGLLFLAPPMPMQGSLPDQAMNEFAHSFWTQDLPRHCSAELKIGQDTKVGLQAMMMPPGYGPNMSGGATLGQDEIGVLNPFLPEMVYTAVQGVPVPQSRYWLACGSPNNPLPIAVPKNELVSLRLEISEHARTILTTIGGPGNTQYQRALEVPTYTYIPVSYRIQATMWGYREVQQRGQLRAS